MYWSPIHGSEKTGTIELLVEVSEDKEPPEAPEGVPTTRWFQGRRFFYIVPIYRFGPGKPQRLPFEIHFWDEMKVHLDEKTQVLSMPHYYKPFPSQRAFRIGKEGILFHLSIDTALTNTLANPPEGHPEASPYLPTESVESFIYFPSNNEPVYFMSWEKFTDYLMYKETRRKLGLQRGQTIGTGAMIMAFQPKNKFYILAFYRRFEDNTAMEKAIRTLIYQSPALNEVVVEPSRQP